MKPVSSWGTNWQNSQARATANYTAGVQAYTGDWAGATTRQQAVMQQNWQQSIASGRWSSGVNAVGTAGWKTATENKAPNYGQGFSAGVNAYNAAAQKVGAALQSGIAGLQPRGDINQNLGRANALALYMHGLKGQLGAR